MRRVETDTHPCGGQISVNRQVRPLVEALCDDAHDLRLSVSRSHGGALLIDAGIEAVGGLEAGRRIAEICLGGLAQVTLTHGGAVADWPLTLHVHTSAPVPACLASQYAGWSLSGSEGGKKFHALGSGPGRAIARKEPLFEELAYRDSADVCTLVLESDQLPPRDVIDYVARSCSMKHDQLAFIVTPSTSLAGSFQVVARVLEVAMHKAHELKFPLEHIVDGSGSAPLAPPAADFVNSMGRMNDAILFAGRVHLFVTGDKDNAETLARRLPGSTSKDYGRPFAQIFKSCDYNFFKIDPMLFSPAKVAVTHLPSGCTFHAGKIDAELLDRSFRG